MRPKLKEIEKIYQGALEREPGKERLAFLDSACQNDSVLRERVDALLRARDGVGTFLEEPIFDSQVDVDDACPIEGPGTVIGRYKLLEKIGEGGMAVVYMAEQEEPIRRKVALKIIKLGMDTKQVIARFEAERQALALMDHPNIAKVLDAGATETGRPYFVMELVTGVSITEYCDKNKLSTKDRLALFIQVCNAVQHAHQKGIIHRDLKPTNILVTQHEGRPVPKVIDFGIAKATNQRLTEKTLFTRYAHIIGTPAYMSPEQAELSDLGLDHRTDVYSLGVLLYELLTGTTPFSEEELRKVGYAEMTRIIREEEPLRPSTRLTQMQAQTSVQIQNPKSKIENELDWIVMKTLEKERVRRYERASDFALDIQRYLEDRPVEAHAPSAGYRLRKFLRRNRSSVIAVTAVLMLVIAMIVLSLWKNHQIRGAEAEAMKQANAVSEARTLIKAYEYAAARGKLRPLLQAENVGFEARGLLASIMGDDPEPEESPEIQAAMNRHYRERVRHYTNKIQDDPADPNNYLQRAQQHHYLKEAEKVRADMEAYRAILNPPKGTAAHEDRLQARAGQETRSGFVFGTPENLGPTINSAHSEGVSDMSSNGLELYFEAARPGGHGDHDIWFAKRKTVTDLWEAAINLAVPVNSPFRDERPCITRDGLTLYFMSTRPGGHGGADLYMTKRVTIGDPWGEPLNLGEPANSSAWEMSPSISADGLSLYFCSNREKLGTIYWALGYIYVATRPTTDDSWSTPKKLGPMVNPGLAYDSDYPRISPDGLSLYFRRLYSSESLYSGDRGQWVATRASATDSWSHAVYLGLRGASPCFSPDGLTMTFCSRAYGGYGDADLFQVPVLTVNRTEKTATGNKSQ